MGFTKASDYEIAHPNFQNVAIGRHYFLGVGKFVLCFGGWGDGIVGMLTVPPPVALQHVTVMPLHRHGCDEAWLWCSSRCAQTPPCQSNRRWHF